MFRSSWKNGIGVLHRLILGVHPNNTVFSFNYHNISQIITFLKRCSRLLGNVNHLLDVGAGRSPYHYIFKDQVENYTAVDLKESLPPFERRKIGQKFGFAENLPIETETVDVVLSNQVLEHVLDADKAVEESFRVLKPGGYMIGSVPHISPVHLEPYDFRRFTDLGVQKILSDNGFVDIRVEGNGSIYRAMAFSVTMDWMLSPRRNGRGQQFSQNKALILSPLVGFINCVAILMEFLFLNKLRSPANLCWIARKPQR